MVEEVTAYKASDGSIHADIASARKRDFQLKVAEFFGVTLMQYPVGIVMGNPESLYRILHDYLRNNNP